MDFSFFDSLIDSAFVINADREIIYCNEAAASLCESSVRRLTKRKKMYDVISFEDADLFPMANGTKGADDAYPLSEVKYQLPSGKDGKLQISIQPFTDMKGEKNWAIVIREVSLEEVLHAKNQERLKQLEEYSKNLEKMVEERTKELAHANQMLSAIMDSLGQGFLTFDEKGECSDVYTKACEDILESLPKDKKIEEVLKVSENEMKTFDMWKQAIFAEQLPFESLKDLGPKEFEHTEDRHITLDFYPIRDNEEKINNIVLVATDKTSEYQANLALEKEKKYAKMIVKLVTSKKQFSQFLDEVPAALASVKQLVSDAGSGTFDHEQAFRILHTIEGEAATYSIESLWAGCREAQEIIEPIKQGWESDASQVLPAFGESLKSIEVGFGQFLDDNREVFELVGIGGESQVEITRAEVESLIDQIRSKNVSSEVTALLSDSLLKESMAGAFYHFNDVIRLVAEKQGKSVSPIEFESDVRVYADHYKGLLSSFVHAFRNAVDHGIEAPEERQMVGKDTSGTIKVKFAKEQSNEGPSIKISISDDGGGIDPGRIRSKLQGREDIPNLDELSDSDVIQYVFDPGLSSRDEVGEFSGRGIGLNAVRDEAIKLGGQAWVESTPGQGTLLQVVIPDFVSELTIKTSA